MKTLRTIYYRLFKRYKVLETKCVSWDEGNRMIIESEGKPEEDRWGLSELEDCNYTPFTVWLCRKVRIKN